MQGAAGEKKYGGAKRLAACAVMAALLVVTQLMLSFAAGVELVTLLLCVFCVTFGPFYGWVTALSFCLLRCLAFGFGNTAVVAVYLIYFPSFAVIIGFYGKLISRAFNAKPVADTDKSPVKRSLNGKYWFCFVGLVFLVAILTACFTGLDDLITPAMMGFGEGSRRLYVYQSLPTLAIHTVCATASVVVLFTPLYIVFEKIKRTMWA